MWLFHSISGEFEKQKEDWNKDLASLKQEASQRSKVCDYILMTSEEGK